MNYREARLYLDSVSEYGSVLGLSRMEALLEGLKRPDRTCCMIHVAGTNGKGSVCAYLSSILQKAGYLVGRYISPTMFHYLERFQINNENMPEETYGRLMERIRPVIEKMQSAGAALPTVFEIETALAFLYFQERKCDFVILECGMGGAGDATNVIEEPFLTIITHVAMDHMQYLGNTKKEIAACKAGIIKGGHPVVLGAQDPEIRDFLIQEAYRRNASSVYNVDPAEIYVTEKSPEGQVFFYRGIPECLSEFTFQTSLAGDYQPENAMAAVLAAYALREEKHISLTDDEILDGVKETTWFGRFEWIPGRPNLILDGAHNPDGAGRLRSSLKQYFGDARHPCIMGVFRDKDYCGILDQISDLCSILYTVELPDRIRSLEAEVLLHEAELKGLKGKAVRDYSEALRLAAADAGADGTVVVFGSLSFLAEMYRIWRNERG